jgi:hypothetical protein
MVSNGICSLIVDVQVKIEAAQPVYVRLSGRGKKDSAKGFVTMHQGDESVALPIIEESDASFFDLIEKYTNNAILLAEKYEDDVTSLAYFEPHLIGDCLSALAPLANYVELYMPRSYHEPALIRGEMPGSLMFAALIMPFYVPLKAKEKASK